MRNQRCDVADVIRTPAEHQDGNISSCQVLLITHVPVDCNEDIETELGYSQQFAIRFAIKACFPDRFTLMFAGGKHELDLSWNTLIEQQPHLSVAVRLDRASSRAVIAAARVTPGK